jgi:hypothetical protein
MRLYYAIGGGLGHLSRAAAVIKTLEFCEHEFVIVSNSDFACQIFRQAKIVKVPDTFYSKPNELLVFFHSIIEQYNVSEIYIDTFPAGLIGELNDLVKGNFSIIYIARILKWEEYLPLIKTNNLIFDHTYVLELLPPLQNEFVKKSSKLITKINLEYPQGNIKNCSSEVLDLIKKKPWLIVHSEPFDELEVLYQHALEIAELQKCNPHFLIISKSNVKIKGDKVLQIDYYPATTFFPYVEKIFTACGFNSMQQTLKYIDIHYFIPFDRRYDDQFKRAIIRKSNLKI